MNDNPQQERENSLSSLNQREGIELVDAYSILIAAFMRISAKSTSSDPKSDKEDKEDEDGEEIQ